MQRKSFVPFIAILLILILAGLGYAGWKAGRQTGDKSWTPPALPAIIAITETPTQGWWGNLPSRPVIPTMPGRIVTTVSITGTSPIETLTPIMTLTITPTRTPLATTSTQTGNTTP
jgi:hypothetical protein